jgi:membrane fusion protein (multidrug efflux system)
VVVSPRISGYVAQVLVTDNQDVKAGTPLVRIDARDFQAKSAQASAQVEVADALVANARPPSPSRKPPSSRPARQLAAAQAKAAYDADQVRRYTPLVASGRGAGAATGATCAAMPSNRRRRCARSQRHRGQQRRIATLQAQIEQAKAQAQAARRSWRGQCRCRCHADPRHRRWPHGRQDRDAGPVCPAGTRLLTLVPLSKIYVVANFKETQLALMRPGQPVSIKVDALDGHTIKGVVDSIAPGTGAVSR